jgi:hypothetical protein
MEGGNKKSPTPYGTSACVCQAPPPFFPPVCFFFRPLGKGAFWRAEHTRRGI